MSDSLLKTTQLKPPSHVSIHSLQSIEFKKMKFSDRLKIKNDGRPTPNFTLVTSVSSPKCGDCCTTLDSAQVYRVNDWVCGCEERKCFFCFPCLLFGGDPTWTKDGVREWRHLKEKMDKHEHTKDHMNHVISLNTFARLNPHSQQQGAHKQFVEKLKELVRKNRAVLSIIVDCIKFCGSFELLGQDDICVSLVNLMTEIDDELKLHLEKASAFKGALKNIVTDLQGCMLTVCRENILQEINNTDFISIIVEDLRDICDNHQIAIVIRYELNNKIYERFWGFFHIEGDNVVRVVLRELKIILSHSSAKLISQSYNGYIAREVAPKIKDVYPFAYHVHSYSHSLDLVLEQASSHREVVRQFFSDISFISEFFNKTPQRKSVLDSVAGRASAGSLKWNLTRRTVNEVYDKKELLIEVTENLVSNHTLSILSVTGGLGIKRFLQDQDIAEWLPFFRQIMPHIDLLQNQLQTRQSDPAKITSAVASFESALKGIQKSLESDKSKPMHQVCDTLTDEVRSRLQFTGHLTASRLVFNSHFKLYSKSFPTLELETTVKAYPCLDKDKLKVELELLFTREELHTDSLTQLLKLIRSYHLESVFNQTSTLIKILVTTPSLTNESDRLVHSLKRVHTFIKNDPHQGKSTAIAMLFLEQQMIQDIPEFNTKVADKFGQLKNRRTDFNVY